MISDNENSVPSNESDEDIYKDISDFNFENVLAKLEGSNEAHRQEASDLAEKVKELTEKNEELRKLNDTLGKNLSTLLKTAQNEIKRKDAMIEELRVQVDSYLIRRNKKTKDKSTSTEDLKYGFDYKNVNKECRIERDNCTNISQSFNEKTSKFNENNFKNKKKVHDNIKDEKIFCDSGKTSNHKNSVSRIRKADEYHRDVRRDDTKYDYLDKERSCSRFHDNHKRTQSRSYRSGRDHHRKSSPKRKRHAQRYRNLSRSLSRSPQRTRHYKESSFERKRISKSPQKKNQQTKSRSNSSNKASDSENYKNFFTTLEGKDQMEKTSKGKSQIKEKKSSSKSENKNNFDFQERLNTFRVEVNPEMTSNQCSSSVSENSKSVLSFKEKVQKAEEQQNHLKYEIQEDWTLSFKNERQNNINPMTVYSWRMLQKLKLDSEKEAENAIRNSNTSKETENFDKVTSKEKKFKIDADTTQTEKEPGELTEDENEVESSKEFQKLTKIASANCFFEKSFLQNPECSRDQGNLNREGSDKKSGAKKRVELTPVKINKSDKEILKDKIEDFEKDVDSPKEVRGLVEFSPFKNNYKLIEISPVKPVETSKSKRLPSDSHALNSVESSTFKLLSALSGIPLYKEPKPKTDQEPLNKKFNSSNVTSTENIKNSKKINVVNTQDEKSVTIENSSNSKILKNRKESKEQENKITKNSPSKKIEIETQKESNKPEIKNNSGLEKTKNKNIDKNEQSSNLIQGAMISENISTSIDKKFDETHDLHGIEKNVLNTNKVSEEKFLKYSPPEKENKAVSKAKDSNSKNEKVISPELKEHFENKQRLKSKEVPEKSIKIQSKKKKEIVLKSPKTDNLKVQSNSKTAKSKKNSQENVKGKSTLKHDSKEGKNCKRKRKLNEKQKLEEINETQDEPIVKRLRSHKDMKNEGNSKEKETIKEDLSFFEFFKPIKKSTTDSKAGKEEMSNSSTDFKVTTTMSVTNVVCLETPNKGIEKLKNFMINEQTIYQVLDTKSNFSPRIGSNCIEMTPRRLLKNDLMLTDSEDDSVVKSNQQCKLQEETEEKSKYENEDEDENDEVSESDCCEWESDSGASDLVDLL